MYNPRESLKTAATIGVAGLGIATLGFGGLGAVLLGGAAAGAGAAGLSSLIDPERPYKVERKDSRKGPATEEEKKRYGEIADRYIANIESFFKGAKTVGKYALSGTVTAVKGTGNFFHRVNERKEARKAKAYQRRTAREAEKMSDEEINSEIRNLALEYNRRLVMDNTGRDPRMPELSAKIKRFREIKNRRSRSAEYKTEGNDSPFRDNKMVNVDESGRAMFKEEYFRGGAFRIQARKIKQKISRVAEETGNAFDDLAYGIAEIGSYAKPTRSGLNKVVVGAGVRGAKAAERIAKYASTKAREAKTAYDEGKKLATKDSFMYHVGERTGG